MCWPFTGRNSGKKRSDSNEFSCFGQDQKSRFFQGLRTFRPHFFAKYPGLPDSPDFSLKIPEYSCRLD